MKKLVYLIMVVVFAAGCKSNPATKLDMKSEVMLKGNWKISSVTYPGSEYFKVTSFNIADAQCFVNSQWKFVSNNNKGEMALSNSKCVTYGSQITWFINKEGNIVMKFLTEGIKAKHTSSGYVLRVANQTENSFQLIDKVNVGGNTSDLVYQFERIN
ncbi:lipocalin family protein [Flavobacterium enshiense]|uniref:lipocalin family protein n=1 Tax=Flavobacterium enshiense TaxID=1341165 RepID=UPI00345C739B